MPAFKRLNPPQRPYTLSCSNSSTFRGGATHCLAQGSRLTAICYPSNPYTLRSGPTHCLVGLQDCPLPAFKCVNPPQRPYTLCCWGVKPFAGLQTRQPSAAALHIVLVGVQECRLPASAPKRFFKPLNFRSGPPDCLVEALSVPFAGLQTRQPSAAALHIVLVGVQECRLPASAPKRFFKPLNFRSGPPDCLVEALSVPFAGLQTAQPSAAALHSTVLFKRLNPPQRRYTLSC